MGMFGGFRGGVWGFHSEKDPRWNVSRHIDCWACTAGMPPEAEEELKRLKKEYGEQPKDLEFSFFKED